MVLFIHDHYLPISGFNMARKYDIHSFISCFYTHGNKTGLSKERIMPGNDFNICTKKLNYARITRYRIFQKRDR